MKKNKTWKLVDKSEADGSKILSSRWIFKVKEDGRNKARLVVRGCEQKGDIDYIETFSPMMNGSSLRILFALAVKKLLSFVCLRHKNGILIWRIG